MEQEIGLIGLAVMGQNLALNIAENGFLISVYNRTYEKTKEFLEGPAQGFSIKGFSDIPSFLKSLQRPRKVLLMVKAGSPVDECIQGLLPFLEKGDIVIDGGNSHFLDTTRREKALSERGILFVGAGISGGEFGARHGPSIMPGGREEAWPFLKSLFQKISAHVEGVPCCDWIGNEGSGHFVKMVHNGIEYADMELIAESYDILHEGFSLDNPALQKVFHTWNKGPLESYLIEITEKIFSKKEADGSFLVDKIHDVAGQKGTGKWTVESALSLGVPLTIIGEAVFARALSAYDKERHEGAAIFSHENRTFPHEAIKDLEHALYAAKILSYTQGFMLLKKASDTYKWDLDLGKIAMMWRGGCIIRSAFLGKINEAYERNKTLPSLLLDPYFSEEVKRSEESLRRIVSQCSLHGIQIPCFSSALSFLDGYTRKRLPINLIQAQRDFFGAHGYLRIDEDPLKTFHADWS